MSVPGMIDLPVRPRPVTTGAPGGPRGVVIYGNRWCGLTQMAARALSRSGVPYDYVDLDEHPEVARKLRMMAGPGYRTPIVYVDGQWLVAPTPAQLRAVALSGAVA